MICIIWHISYIIVYIYILYNIYYIIYLIWYIKYTHTHIYNLYYAPDIVLTTFTDKSVTQTYAGCAAKCALQELQPTLCWPGWAPDMEQSTTEEGVPSTALCTYVDLLTDALTLARFKYLRNRSRKSLLWEHTA